jgi:lactate permease
VAFAIPQFLVSNFHGPWLVDTISAACSIAALVLLLRIWKPKPSLSHEGKQCLENQRPEFNAPGGVSPPAPREERAGERRPSFTLEHQDQSLLTTAVADKDGLHGLTVFRAWSPWLILTLFILVWGLPGFKRKLDSIAAPKVAMPYLHNSVQRVPPVAPASASPEKAEFNFNILSATGTGILLAALVAGFVIGCGPQELARTYLETIWRIRFSLLTIAAMMALGNVTKYSGADATLGLALAHTGRLYPFFGTLLGWLGVALTGSDTASNVLFGSLQKITAEQTGVSPILMAAANSSGGVMGKMVDAQSIVVASTATNWYGHEGSILRFVFIHSLTLAALVGVLVFLQAYVFPFTRLVVR